MQQLQLVWGFFFYVRRHGSVDKLQFVCTFMWVLYFSSLSLSQSAFLPRFQSSSEPPTQNNTANLQEYIINFPSEMAAALDDKCSLHPIPPSFPPSPSFHFHFSFPVVHLRHKYSLDAPPLCSCRLSSHLRGHADTPHTHRTLHTHSHTSRHGLNIMSSQAACWIYTGK